MNKFQKFMISPANYNIAIEIVKILYPNIESEIGDKKLKIYTKYDWVCIEYSKLGISLGLKYSVSKDGINSIMSGFKPMSDFILAHGKSSFKMWGFVDDAKYKKINEEEVNSNLNKLFIKYNVPKPTAREMFVYYHRD